MVKRIEIEAGGHVMHAIDVLLRAARASGDLVTADFNGFDLTAAPDSLHSDLRARYDKECRAREQRAAALSAAESAVVKAAEEWHAADSEEPCDPERIISRLEALRSACRELAERRGRPSGKEER